MKNIVEKRRNCCLGAISPLFHNILLPVKTGTRFFFFIYTTTFKEDTQLASKASLSCGPLKHTNIKYIQIYTLK